MPSKRRRQTLVEQVRQEAFALGARHAKVISPRKVFTAPWVRLKCQYGCEGYGSSRLCPPHSPTPEQTRKVLDCYRRAILVHGDKTADIRRIVTAIEREAFLAGFYKAFSFACGPCRLCKECAFDAGCRHSEQARPAMEACGIDVFRTARAAGLPIRVVKDERCDQNYYGLLLLD